MQPAFPYCAKLNSRKRADFVSGGRVVLSGCVTYGTWQISMGLFDQNIIGRPNAPGYSPMRPCQLITYELPARGKSDVCDLSSPF